MCSALAIAGVTNRLEACSMNKIDETVTLRHTLASEVGDKARLPLAARLQWLSGVQSTGVAVLTPAVMASGTDELDVAQRAGLDELHPGRRAVSVADHVAVLVDDDFDDPHLCVLRLLP